MTPEQALAILEGKVPRKSFNKRNDTAKQVINKADAEVKVSIPPEVIVEPVQLEPELTKESTKFVESKYFSLLRNKNIWAVVIILLLVVIAIVVNRPIKHQEASVKAKVMQKDDRDVMIGQLVEDLKHARAQLADALDDNERMMNLLNNVNKSVADVKVDLRNSYENRIVTLSKEYQVKIDALEKELQAYQQAFPQVKQQSIKPKKDFNKTMQDLIDAGFKQIIAK